MRRQQLVFIVALTYFAMSQLFSVVNAAAGQDAASLDALARFAAAALLPGKAAGAVERLAAELAGPRLAAIKGDALAVDLG